VPTVSARTKTIKSAASGLTLRLCGVMLAASPLNVRLTSRNSPTIVAIAERTDTTETARVFPVISPSLLGVARSSISRVFLSFSPTKLSTISPILVSTERRTISAGSNPEYGDEAVVPKKPVGFGT
jgi:hypothetical protein